MNVTKTLFISLLMWLLVAASLNASVLSSLAASMQPGTWAQLTTNNDVQALATESGMSGILTGYSFSGIWDPVGKRIHFMGADHHGGQAGYGQKWVYYDDATNSWVVYGGGTGNVEGLAQVMPLIPQHGFDHLTIDPVGRMLYLYAYGSKNIWKYPLSSSGPWTSISMPATGYINITTGMEWFPGMGLTVYITGEASGEEMVMNAAGNWTDLTGWGPTGGGYSGFAEYSPNHHVVVFGGPSAGDAKQIWRMDSNKTITKLTSAPFPLGQCRGNVVADPVTGDYLVLGNGQFWALDPSGAGTWTIQTGSRVPPSGVGNPISDPSGVISTAISSYGVILYTSCRIGNCTQYLYKHAAGTGAENEVRADSKTAAPVSVWPNPVTGMLQISALFTAGGLRAGLYTITGQCIADFSSALKIDKTLSWDASHLSNGVYLLKAIQGSRTFVKQVLIQK